MLSESCEWCFGSTFFITSWYQQGKTSSWLIIAVNCNDLFLFPCSMAYWPHASPTSGWCGFACISCLRLQAVWRCYCRSVAFNVVKQCLHSWVTSAPVHGQACRYVQPQPLRHRSGRGRRPEKHRQQTPQLLLPAAASWPWRDARAEQQRASVLANVGSTAARQLL